MADAELNKMSKDVQSFSGKFKGAADVAKQFSKHMKDAQQFTIDNIRVKMNLEKFNCGNIV